MLSGPAGIIGLRKSSNAALLQGTPMRVLDLA
jgi:hypothetical protein